MPSISTPRSVISTSRIPPQTIPESAALKTGQTLPSGANSDTMSTTCPRSGPGSRNSRSVRLPSAPPSTSPSPIAQPGEASRRAIRTITPTTTIAMIVSTHV